MLKIKIVTDEIRVEYCELESSALRHVLRVRLKAY